MYHLIHNKRSQASTTPSTLAFEKTGKKFDKNPSTALQVIPPQQSPFPSRKKPSHLAKCTPRRVDRFALETNGDPTTRSHFTILTQPQPGGEVVQLNFYTAGSVLDNAQTGEVYFEAIHF